VDQFSAQTATRSLKEQQRRESAYRYLSGDRSRSALQSVKESCL
jgi:hypothetical protein